MSNAVYLRVLIITALATALSALSLLNSGAARAEDTCLTAPKSGASGGGHWRYRLERGTQRKCWHLVSAGRKAETQRSETQNGRTAALRAEPAAPADPQPQTQVQAEKLTQTEPQPGPAPINDAVQRFTQPVPSGASQAPASAQSFGNAVAQPQATPDAPPAQAADPAPSANVATTPATSSADASPRVADDAQATTAQSVAPADPAAQAQPVAPVVVPKRKAAAPDVDSMRMLPFAIGALAASLVAAGFIFASASRRRQDTIVRIVDLNAKAPPRHATREVASPSLAMREPWQDSWEDSRQISRQHSRRDDPAEETGAPRRPSPARRHAA